jgi:carboxypeptidase C (cathepsin A)
MTLRPCAFALLLALTPVAATAQRGERPAQAPQNTPAPGANPAPANTPKQPEEPKTLPDHLPADKSIPQTAVINGKTIHYTATVGTIDLKAKDGKTTGQVMYIAYTVDQPKDAHNSAAQRPVTFAFNGGPGASSTYLNFGAIGPKHIAFANAGDSASDPAVTTDNPASWLDFTDLVFLDPIGTGFSRSFLDDAETKKQFYSPTPDVEYLSLVIYKWLVKNDRLLAKKYLIGESYGGYRGPRMTHYLQSELGVGVNGLFLVSPYLNPDFGSNLLSPVPWMTTLPSITAAHLEAQNNLTPDAMRTVIDYTEGPYATALIQGPQNKQATDTMIDTVTKMTGLDPAFVRHEGGRLEIGAYLREVHRERGEIGSVYDSNVTAPDPFPYSYYNQTNDPILESIVAPTTEAAVDFITRQVGWKTDARYYALSEEVNRQWDRATNNDLRRGAVPDLREAIAADPKLHVVIFHGWNDLSCPFMGSVLTQNQLPATLAKQLEIHEFPGGHMFYTRAQNGTGLHELAEKTVATH